jgi:hypothetical protein
MRGDNGTTITPNSLHKKRKKNKEQDFRRDECTDRSSSNERPEAFGRSEGSKVEDVKTRCP